MATLFRGYEVIMVGRDPRDAIFITSRACGVCGGVHSVRRPWPSRWPSAVVPPPLGHRRSATSRWRWSSSTITRCICILLAGPDYSAAMVGPTNPSLLARARSAEAPHAEIHGFRTIGELMEDLNPLSGKLYLEALHMTRVAREAYVLICGKYPHPQTIVPGGMSSTITLTVMNEMFIRLAQFFDYSKKLAAIWDDLTEFFYEANPAYKQVGARRANLIDTGIFDHHEAYDATYAGATAWGERRWATPGVIMDGQLVTTDLHALNIGVEEFVEHSYYEEWSGSGQRQHFPTDPVGQPALARTIRGTRSPSRVRRGRTGRRSTPGTRRRAGTGRPWKPGPTRGSGTPRWRSKLPANPFIEATGTSLKLRLPKGALPELELEWKVPAVWNAFERNRARAYCTGFTALVALNNWLAAMDRLKQGDTKTSTPFEIPKRGEQRGVGFWGAGRGYLTHHLTLDRGAVANYQIITPSTWNASPSDRWRQPGPYEEAVLNTPLLEETDDPAKFKGIDILRAIRSFDPCMPCTTHIHSDAGVITREVNTCACGIDDDGG